MNRGPLFRLLRLDRAVCPHCHRDLVFRVDDFPMVCRWCGEFTIDFASLTRTVQDMMAALAISLSAFADTARAVMRIINAFVFVSPVWASAYVVDVETATHDDLKEGETVTRISRVQVLAADETEAKLVACQMAARDGRMPTRATVRSQEEVRAEEGARQITQAYRLDNPLGFAIELRKDVP